MRFELISFGGGSGPTPKRQGIKREEEKAKRIYTTNGERSHCSVGTYEYFLKKKNNTYQHEEVRRVANAAERVAEEVREEAHLAAAAAGPARRGCPAAVFLEKPFGFSVGFSSFF